MLRRWPPVLPLALAVCLGACADTTADPAADATAGDSGGGPADVRVNAERVALDSLSVTADSVWVDFTLDANVGALLTIDAGVEVRAGNVVVTADTVAADLRVEVRLDRVSRVLLEALEAVRENPDLVRGADAPPAAGAAPSARATGAPDS